MVLSDTSKGRLGWKKWFITAWAFMECLLFSGLLYGWGSVNFVLKMEGVYSELCDEHIENISTDITRTAASSTTFGFISSNKPTTIQSILDIYTKPCKQQDKKMALCYTIAAAVYGAGSFVAGLINYRFGMRTTRLIGTVIFTTGTLIMSFVSKDYPWLMFPGFALVSFGGFPIMLTNVQMYIFGRLMLGYLQVAYLFTDGASTVVGLMHGGFSASTVTMLLIKIAHQHGYTRRNMFLVITALHCLVLISTFFFLPKYFIVKIKSVDDNGEEKGNKSADAGLGLKPNYVIPTLKSCLLSSKYLTHLVWFSLLNLRFHYFVGTLNQYLTRLLHVEDQVSYFTDVCFYIMLSGLILSFLTGVVYDSQKRTCKDGKSPLYRELMPAVLPLVLTCMFGVIMSILVLIPAAELLYVTFIVMAMFRALLVSSAVAFLRDIFPSQYFAVMYGVLKIVGVIFASLQYAIFVWADSYDDGPFHGDTFLLCLTLLSSVRPLYLWITCKRDEHRCTTLHLKQDVYSITTYTKL